MIKVFLSFFVVLLVGLFIFTVQHKSVYAAGTNDTPSDAATFYGSSGTAADPSIGDSLKAKESYNNGDANMWGFGSSYATNLGNWFASVTLPFNQAGTGQATKTPDRSVVGFFTNSINTMITNPPASSEQYVAYLDSRVNPPNFVGPAYAVSTPNGLGYAGLNPILKVWEASRNLAYLILSVIFIVIAFMIIFRVKIDPKTVVSLQNALPKIFLAAILIYFSYAIAGLLIDIMYVSIAVITNLLLTIFGTGSVEGKDLVSIQKGLPSDTIFGIFGSGKFFAITTNVSQAFGEIIQNLIDSNKGVGGQVAGFGSNVIAWVIICAAIIFALFKTWFALLNAYIQIILGVISAPLFLMFEAIPGRSVFGIWFKNMLSNILVFPFTILMIMVGSFLTVGWQKAITQDAFVPPLLGGNSLGAIQALIGLAVILTIPKGINILQELIKTPPFKYGNAWAESMQGGFGMTKAGATQGANFTGVPQARQLVNQVQSSKRTQEMLGGIGWRSIFSPVVKGFGPPVDSKDIQNLTKIDPKQ